MNWYWQLFCKFATHKGNTFFATNMPLANKVPNLIITLVVLFSSLFFGELLFAQEFSKINRVVIDAGHGGKDPGSISKNGKYKEKDITLSVALKLGGLIKSKFPDVTVFYTRTTDKYVALDQRASIANSNKADLFISIHVNSTSSAAAKGTETFVMGSNRNKENFEVCKAENSVIVIEEDYERKYQGFDPNSPESYIIFSLLQNTHLEQSLKFADLVQKELKSGPIYVNRGVKQGGLVVLWRTTMPAVLTEIGFLSNSADLAILTTKEGQNKIANRLFSAFSKYKAEYESGLKEDEEEQEFNEREKEEVKVNIAEDNRLIENKEVVGSSGKDREFYAVQILSVAKELPKGAYDLKGEKEAKYIKVGNLYKYYLGEYKTRAEASKRVKEVQKRFKGSFVIHVKNGEIIK